MQIKSVAVIGASGLIGGELLSFLMSDHRFERVMVLTRRSLGIVHPKIQECVIDFHDKEAVRQSLNGTEIIFCTIGTTMKKVKGDLKLYRQIDFDIPLQVALIGKEIGIRQFLLVTAFGADSKSRNFYLRLKGEVEDAIHSLNLPSFSVFHPSVLLGNRKEFRPAERVAVTLLPFIEWLFPFNYRSIKASTVAKAMICAAADKKTGFHIYSRKEMFVF